jgi:hypothetical protein
LNSLVVCLWKRSKRKLVGAIAQGLTLFATRCYILRSDRARGLRAALRQTSSRIAVRIS